MLNAQPLNSGPLNSLPALADGPEPIVLEPGSGFAWRWALTLGGVDVSDTLLGMVRIESVEDGDKVASFDLWLGPDPVDIVAYTGRALTIDFVVRGEVEVADRRFTGVLVQPEFDVLRRTLACTATTRLPETFEAKPLAEIDAFVGGSWSVDVFEDTAGRSRWDYTKERLSTRPASLNVSRAGEPRITSWWAANISYEFGPGTTVYESLDIALASLSETTNVVELELDYRYSRYRERSQQYSWVHPGTGGLGGLGGLMEWMRDSTELPDINMVTDAVDSTGWFISWAQWYRLPGDQPQLPQPFYNKNIDLLLGADFVASVRWSQRAVERYLLRLEIPAAVAAVGEVIARERVVLDTDTDADKSWEESRFTLDELVVSGDDPLDRVPRRDQDRLDLAGTTALRRSQTDLLSAWRRNQVSWQVPLAHALGIDVGQRLKLGDQGAAITGTVVTTVEEGDLESGSALLTITLAVSRSETGALADALLLPAAPGFEDDPAPVVEGALPTQIGLRADSPLYDEALPGFAGSYSIGNGDPALRYPRRFAMDTPEIPEQWRDEVLAEVSTTLRVAPPVDQLEV